MKIIEKMWELEHLLLGRPQGYCNFREEFEFSGSWDHEKPTGKKSSEWWKLVSKGPVFLRMYEDAAD